MMEILVRQFVDVERTGDKLYFRYNLLLIFDYFWAICRYIYICNVFVAKESTYNQTFQELEKTNPELFASFINYFLNDLTFLRDNAFEGLAIIKGYQDLQLDQTAWNALSAQDKRVKQETFNHAEKHSKGCIQVIIIDYYLTFITRIHKKRILSEDS